MKKRHIRLTTTKKALHIHFAIIGVIMLACLLLTFVDYTYKGLLVFSGLCLLLSMVFFTTGYYFVLPLSFLRRRPLLYYLALSALEIAFLFVFCLFFAYLLIGDLENSITYAVLNGMVLVLITLPVTWILYKRQLRDTTTILDLQKELGRTTASFDFLRSQINPHFLFNALNTIYGTALEEGAGRTSEGIERLASMMRFMLQENMQMRIPLSKELNYLRNYIELQRLRMDPHASVTIEASIPDSIPASDIAPMLLVPFVENAFKHGISFRESSPITLCVEVVNNRLSFEISNTVHSHRQHHHEDQAGIGLNNVRQRLQLLYAEKHELTIQHTENKFHVYLKIQLDEILSPR